MRGRRMGTTERALADLLHPPLKAPPEKRRLMPLTVTDMGGGA